MAINQMLKLVNLQWVFHKVSHQLCLHKVRHQLCLRKVSSQLLPKVCQMPIQLSEITSILEHLFDNI